MAVEVVIPALGLTVEKGTILKWMKKEGDGVSKGESIYEVEADKVTTEVESPASGVLKKILIPEGVEVPILTPVAVIADEKEVLPEKYVCAAVGASGEEGRGSSPPGSGGACGCNVRTNRGQRTPCGTPFGQGKGSWISP